MRVQKSLSGETEIVIRVYEMDIIVKALTEALEYSETLRGKGRGLYEIDLRRIIDDLNKYLNDGRNL